MKSSHNSQVCLVIHSSCATSLPNVIVSSRSKLLGYNVLGGLQQQTTTSSYFVVQFDPFQAQGTNTIMCNEFGETIAIIATSEGEELPLEQALEIYQTAVENSLAAERLQLLWGQTTNRKNNKNTTNSPLYSAFTKSMSLICNFNVCMKLFFFCCLCHWRNVKKRIIINKWFSRW